MKFSFKKALCLLLTVCILCTTLALPVFANTESSNSVVIAEGLTAEKLSSLRQSHTINPGRDITYTIHLENSTNANKDVVVTDVLPGVATLKEGCDNVEGSLMTWNVTVPANGSLDIVYTLTVNDSSAILGSALEGGNAKVEGVSLDCYDIYIENTFGEVDNKKLISSIDTLNQALVTDTELARIIYNNATSFNFTMAETSNKVLEQIFVTGVNAGAGSGSSGGVEEMPAVAANYMEMIVPTLYGGTKVDITPDNYFRGEPNLNPTKEDLMIGDLVFLGNTSAANVYIYNGDQLVKLVSGDFKEVVREDANQVLSKAVASEMYIVLRPSFVLTAYHQSTPEVDENLSEAQKAVIYTALAYQRRGYRVQYDDTTMNINQYRWQHSLYSPESYTQDNIHYTNCAAFCNDVYKNSIGYEEDIYSTNILLNAKDNVWKFTRTDTQTHTAQEKADTEADFYENLQPGDIINVRYNKSKGGGHAMLYVGNGTIIHSGGSIISYGSADTIETSIKVMRVADLWTESNSRYVFSKLNSINIVRPLHNWKGEIPQNTINRITTMKGIVGEKLSSKNEYTTVNPGDEITYTFSVYNTNEETKTLEISDKVPENTSFVSGDLTDDNGNLSYTITVGANETKTVSYTVKVNENTPLGTKIESNEATIGGVIHPTHIITVANTLTDAQQTQITTSYNNNKESLKGVALANAIYKDVLGVEKVLPHDTIDDILNIASKVVKVGDVINETTVTSLSDKYIGNNYYFLLDSYYGKMIPAKLLGGRYVYSPNGSYGDDYVRYPRQAHIIPGDIIVAKGGTGSGLYLYTKEGLVNLDKATINTDVDSACHKLLGNNCFIVLRPSITDSYEYIKTPIESFIDELKALNKLTIKDEETVVKFETKVAEFEAYLTANPDAKLTSVQQTVYDIAKLKIKEYRNPKVVAPEEHIEADGKIWFALGGNSRFFVKTDEEAYLNRANYTDFLPGVDFAGYVGTPKGDFAKDQAAITNPAFGGSMLAYTVGANNTSVGTYTLPDFSYENGNHFWTIKGTKYLVRPDHNVIKLIKTAPNTTNITDQAIKDRYASLTETTIDVPDKKYESLGFLAACVTAYRKFYKVTIYYADNTTDTQVEEISGSHNPNTSSATYKDGIIYLANFLDTSSQRDSRFGFVPWDVDIDSEKVITKIKFEIDAADTNTSRLAHIISVWGVPVEGTTEPEAPQPSALDTLVTELEALNDAGITSDSALSAVEAKVAEIDTYLAENTDATLSAAQEEVYNTAKAKIKAYKDSLLPQDPTDSVIRAEGKVWFNLNGNARFFVKSDEEAYTNRNNYKDYLPGVDFAGLVYNSTKDYTPVGEFATDQTGVSFPSNGGAMFVYTLDKNNASPAQYTLPDFTTGEDDNIYWEIDGVKYLIQPTKNIIKNAAQKVVTSKLTDADAIARYQSLNTAAVIDVPDGRYESVGILTGAMLKYTKYVSVSLYYEGESEPVVVDGDEMKMYVGALSSYKEGTLCLQNFLHSDPNNGGAHYFVPRTIATDSSKVLTKIEVKDKGSNNKAYPLYVISAWGVEKTLSVEELITELEALNTAGITDLNSLNALKAKVEEIDAALLKTSSELTAEQKVVYDRALVLIAEKENEFSSATDNLKSKININFNGNSKLYMEYGSDEYLNRATLKNFLPGLDFTSIVKNPTGDFETDFAYATGTGENFSGPIAVFPYTLDSTAVGTIKATSVPNFTTDAKGNTIWTIDNVPYAIKPTEKVIKLYQQCNTSAISKNDALTDKEKEELTAAYNSVSEITIDVADGQYEKLGFLAGIFHTTASYNRILDIKLIYEDGEVDASATIWASATTDNNYTKGALYFHALEDGTTSGTKYWHTFKPYEVTADSSRTLTAIKLIKPTTRMANGAVTNDSNNSYVYPVYVLSVYADQTIKGALSAVSATTSYTDAVTIVKTVDAILAENSLTADDLSESAKVNYNLAKAIVDGAADLFEQSIKQAENAMKAITVNSSLEDAKAAEKLYLDALAIDGIDEDDFDTAIVTSFYATLNTIKENTELSGNIEIIYNKDALPYAKVTINNPSELSAKPYKVILTYFDEKDVQIGKKIIDGTSTTANKNYFEIEINDMPENTKTIKGFIWKDFATLLPLSEEVVATKSDKNVLKVLAIGNSFSNDALTYFYDIAKSAGYDEVVLGVAYIGGATLNTHISQYNGNLTGYTYRKNTTGSWIETPGYDLKSIIKDERWDYITLQQGSSASGQPDTYDPYLEQLIKIVNDNKTNSKAKLLWHTTWTFTSNYTRDSQYKTLYNEDQMTMYNAIMNAFTTKVQPYITSGAIEYAIPVGTAIQNAREAYSDESLFSSDGLHLNSTGDYIAGLTWFEKITGKSIDTVTYIPTVTGIEEKLDVIKKSVKDALANPTSVTK